MIPNQKITFLNEICNFMRNILPSVMIAATVLKGFEPTIDQHPQIPTDIHRFIFLRQMGWLRDNQLDTLTLTQ